MDEQDIHINKWLTPLSWLYGIAVKVRNTLFDWNVLPTRHFDVPVICVGNLVAGGTGKTPHTEYLIRLLQENFNVAVLSRGYKRLSHGYLLANEKSTASDIGDEPYQMMRKFSNIRIAVDADRCRGIERLSTLKDPPVDIILLDDAYQYRYVDADINLLLTDYHRLFCNDALLPAGRLRESAEEKERAHAVIVTKCPDDIKPIDFNVIAKQLELYPFQQLFFSRLEYGDLYQLFDKDKESKPIPLSSLQSDTEILLLTGIAYHQKLVNKLMEYVEHIHLLRFPDHHNYTSEDMTKLSYEFQKLPKGKRIIVTTEKDAARLQTRTDINEVIREHLYVQPVRIAFLQDQQKLFNQFILKYVRKNKGNSILS